MDILVHNLEVVLSHYKESFKKKEYNIESEEIDLLMEVFNISQIKKIENRQYWGRELGMCWQRLIVELFKSKDNTFKPAYKKGNDELCDLVSGNDAIDTKYRIGSGDSGTIKKFKAYSKTLSNDGYKPIMLILRKDNLPQAISACNSSGWDVKIGEESFDYIKQKTNYNLDTFLFKYKNGYKVF